MAAAASGDDGRDEVEAGLVGVFAMARFGPVGGEAVPSGLARGPVQLGGELLFELAQLAADGRVLERSLACEPSAEPGDGGGSVGGVGVGVGVGMSLRVIAVVRGAAFGPAAHRAPA